MKIKNVKIFLVGATVLASSCLITGYVGFQKAKEMTDHIGWVNFSERPEVHTRQDGLVTFKGHVAKFGEYGDLDKAINSYAALLQNVEEYWPDNTPRGFAGMDTQKTFANHDICVVSVKQHAQKVMHEGTEFYRFKDALTLFEADKHDFFVQSHETQHCFFKIPTSEALKEPMVEQYAISLMEVAADLGSMLDYMRLTGTNDLYHDHIKPFRMSKVYDVTHSTIFAIEYILSAENIDPMSMREAKVTDIHKLVSHLMSKYFYVQDKGYIPTRGKDGEFQFPETQAAIFMRLEMQGKRELRAMTQEQFEAGEYGVSANALRAMVARTLTGHLHDYEGRAPERMIDQVAERQNFLFAQFDLFDFQLDRSPPEPRSEVIMDQEKVTGRGVYDYYTNSL